MLTNHLRFSKYVAGELTHGYSLDSVKATGANETPDALWGEGKPDPKDILEKNGFLMRKVALNAAANPGRRGGRGPRNRKRGPKKGNGKDAAAPAPAAST